MRFLMLNWRDPRNPKAGGAERVTLGYLAALAKRGHEVYWFAYGFPGGSREETIDGVRIIRGGGMVSSIFAARQWYRLQPRFDLVIDQHHGIPWFAPWWAKTRCVAYIHEVLGPIWSSFYPWPMSWLGRWQERWTHWLYRNTPFWTASSCTKENLEKHGVRSVTTIPYGVDIRPLAELPEKTLGEPLKLIVVSRLAPNKRIDHCVKALAILLSRKVWAQLTIIGGGEEEPKLRTLVKELNLSQHVEFPGQLSEAEKDARLREAHLLLHTSIREGWGLNVIEANAMGTPGVVYPVAGLVESTLHQDTGEWTNAETPEALADTLTSLLKRPADYERYRQSAWRRAGTFHWDKVLPLACDWLEQQAKR